MSQDLISDALNQIMNMKKAGKNKVQINRTSKVLIKVLELMKNKEVIDFKIDSKERKITIDIKNLDLCMAIKPRFNVKIVEIDKYMRRFLPARGVGTIIISTNKGMLTHEDAIKQNLGGSLIAYFY